MEDSILNQLYLMVLNCPTMNLQQMIARRKSLMRAASVHASAPFLPDGTRVILLEDRSQSPVTLHPTSR